MRLILVRHGQTPANVLGQLDTAHPGPGLTERGLEQAARIPDALRGEDIDAIYVSTLIRTQLTAAPLVADRGLAATVLGGIHEIEAGDLEKRSDAEAIHIYHSTIFAWGSGDLEPRMPGDQDGHAPFCPSADPVGRVDGRVDGRVGGRAGSDTVAGCRQRSCIPSPARPAIPSSGSCAATAHSCGTPTATS